MRIDPKTLTKKQKLYPWVVMAACCLYMAGGIGIGTNNVQIGSNTFNGYLTFTDAWFDEYMFRIVINKRYLDEASRKAAEQKPIQLPAWDYMF